ncbi:MAG TPA: UDP-glucuronic acid decarboxylase family protein [archaeon]|nr:UDP-glucuronic acid decarboxylase family protein [archaeon]
MAERILVAGGAGFIGSHLCDYLIARGYQVVCVDSLITGNKKNISHLLKSGKFSFLKKDISKKISVGGKISQIYNLASPASPVDYQQKPLQTLEAGSAGVKNLLDFARSKGAKFLFASTSEVYGNPLEHPQKETYWGNVNSFGPRSCYDEAKRFGEALCYSYREKYSLDVKIARIFNTYGPRMRKDDGRVVPNFIVQALAQKPITIYGDGSQTRSFCYVSDMVDGLYKLMNSQETSPVNLGNPNEITILGLARLITSIAGGRYELVYADLPADDPERRLPDISLAKQKLGWQPEVGLGDGLRKTIDFFRTA